MTLSNHLDLNQWVTTLGYVGICGIVFAETGLFFCFFLPGDSLLFTAGLLAHRQVFHIGLLVPSIIVTAATGYFVSYWVGKHLRHWLIQLDDRWWFRQAYLERARSFYDQYGKNALLIGRLVPIVRTFVPVVAGMTKMNRRTFILYNCLGAVIWGALVPLLGYFLGAILPDANKYLLLAVVLIVIFSVLPGVFHWWKDYRKQRA